MDMVIFNVCLALLQTIRVHRLEDLMGFMADNIFVIHLVRDPRSMMRSWTEMPHSTLLRGLNKYSKVSYYCDDITADLAFRPQILSTPLSRFYYLLRYEDLVFEPEYHIHSLFDAIGISISAKVGTTGQMLPCWLIKKSIKDTCSLGIITK